MTLKKKFKNTLFYETLTTSQKFRYRLSIVTRTRFKKISLEKIRARWSKGFLSGFVNIHLVDYPTPACLTYAWSFGFLAGVCMAIQMISGSLLSIHYIADMKYAFQSIQYIMRDVPNGWLIRYTHTNGASMFFIVLYCHIFRGLYYGSYMKPRQALWCSGVVLLILVMAAAFTGYVLPWGQMSFWGATVITNMVTILPGGRSILEWVWGGYTINQPATLRRFYTLHFTIPYLIVGVTLIHISLLHKVGSTGPVGSDINVDNAPFFPYFFLKDLEALGWFLVVLFFFVVFAPEALNHPYNYIPADPMETPEGLVPEWYFLPFYAILRSIPHKTGGILTMAGSVLVLFLIPFTYTGYIRNTTYRPLFKIFFWFLVADFIAMFYLGQAPIKDWSIELGQYTTIYYYLFFVVIVPVVGIIENTLVFYEPKEKSNTFFSIVDRDLTKKPYSSRRGPKVL